MEHPHLEDPSPVILQKLAASSSFAFTTHTDITQLPCNFSLSLPFFTKASSPPPPYSFYTSSHHVNATTRGQDNYLKGKKQVPRFLSTTKEDSLEDRFVIFHNFIFKNLFLEFLFGFQIHANEESETSFLILDWCRNVFDFFWVLSFFLSNNK